MYIVIYVWEALYSKCGMVHNENRFTVKCMRDNILIRLYRTKNVINSMTGFDFWPVMRYSSLILLFISKICPKLK